MHFEPNVQLIDLFVLSCPLDQAPFGSKKVYFDIVSKSFQDENKLQH